MSKSSDPLDPLRVEATRQLLTNVAIAAGHQACWFNPEQVLQLMHIWGIKPAPALERARPPRCEFRQECQRFEAELYEDEQDSHALGPSGMIG